MQDTDPGELAAWLRARARRDGDGGHDEENDAERQRPVAEKTS
jgi:hypothetical protein